MIVSVIGNTHSFLFLCASAHAVLKLDGIYVFFIDLCKMRFIGSK